MEDKRQEGEGKGRDSSSFLPVTAGLRILPTPQMEAHIPAGSCMPYQPVLDKSALPGQNIPCLRELAISETRESKRSEGGVPPRLGQLVGLIINFPQSRQSPLSSSIPENVCVWISEYLRSRCPPPQALKVHLSV